MSLNRVRRKRTTLFLCIAGLALMVMAVTAVSASDPSGVSIRAAMVLLAFGAALWLPWRLLAPAVALAWLTPNLARNLMEDAPLLSVNAGLEAAGIVGIAVFTALVRYTLRQLENENLVVGAENSSLVGLDPETGVFYEHQLRPSLQAELARSRRFGRTFSLVLVGIDEMRQKFDYPDEAGWKASFDATSRLLLQTRYNVDRVFYFKGGGFAMLLPEATARDIPGLVKRLRKLARSLDPAEGKPGGPLPIHFGATFYPECATTVDDLLRRAEIALRIAVGSTTRYQLDSAEAPALPAPETQRRTEAPAAGTGEITGVTEATDTPSGTAGESIPEPVAVPGVASIAPEAGDVRANGMHDPAHGPVADVPSGIEVVSAAILQAGPSTQDRSAHDVNIPNVDPDEVEALLKQMNETLKMIRSMRKAAA